MLKTVSSCVLASLKPSTDSKVRLGLSLAAALLADRFEHLEKQDKEHNR
jgi:hypothetical protein